MRVTHVVFDLEGGGLESMVASMTRLGAKYGITTSIITLSGRAGRTGAMARQWTDQFEILEPMRRWSMLMPTALIQSIKRTRPDVVHLHSGAWYKPALAARLAHVPVIVYTEHGREHRDPPLQRALDRLASRWTSAVVAVSDRLSGYMQRTLGLSADQVRIIQNGVDTEYFSPDASRPRSSIGASFGEKEGRVSPELRSGLRPAPTTTKNKIIGAIGRLETVKGHDLLLEAFARMRALDPSLNVKLVIAGEGSCRAALEAQAKRLGIADAVQWPGWTDTPRDFYRQFDAFVLPSRSEGTSVSLLEAMSCGAAPVVTNVGSNAAVLGPALAAQVVPTENPEALASGLLATLRDNTHRTEISHLARQRVLDAYSIDATMRAYLALYGTLVGTMHPR